MTQWHMKSKRKPSGGLRYSIRRSDKKLAWKGGDFANTKLAKEEKRKVVKGRGNTTKTKLLNARYASVSDERGKTHKVELVNVIENNANRQYARMQVVTKGAIVEGLMNGKKVYVRITSRPGQHGIVQGIFLSDDEVAALKSRKGITEKKEKKVAEKQETHALEEKDANTKEEKSKSAQEAKK